jgi:hypothetical protein
MKSRKSFRWTTLAVALAPLLAVRGAAAADASPPIGERPTLASHVSEADIEQHKLSLRQILDVGRTIFAARWNTLDGQGRPAATGNGSPTKRDPSHDVGFIRTSGPDSSSCADCHHQPEVGGAGGFVSNVFVLAQNRDPVTDSVASDFSDERNTLGMNGSGAIEMLAREMTTDLQSIRAATIAQAKASGQTKTQPLVTKGVGFGSISAHADGSLDTSGVQGVDADLIIKPFHQKGVVNSVRVFSVNAFNHHHGMEAVERFGKGQLDSTGNPITTDDFDEDGVPDELSVGDITAATLFQVALNVPGRVIASDQQRRAAAARGEARFADIGCATCHVPALSLQSRMFSEPNPFNPAGNLRVQDVSEPYTFDMTSDGPAPHLERVATGGATVRAYTDLKRHVICDDDEPYYCNEKLVQAGVPTNQFVTRKLWDVGNTAPYGHRGDLTTISEAILHHGGEARDARVAFSALPGDQQGEIVEFLRQLQVLPAGAPSVITDAMLAQFEENLGRGIGIAH